jgi:hypothetical protein
MKDMDLRDFNVLCISLPLDKNFLLDRVTMQADHGTCSPLLGGSSF